MYCAREDILQCGVPPFRTVGCSMLSSVPTSWIHSSPTQLVRISMVATCEPWITSLAPPSSPPDQTNLMVTQDGQLERVKLNQQAWIRLSKWTNQSRPSSHMTQQDAYPNYLSFDCISHALQWALTGRAYSLPSHPSVPLPPPPPNVLHAEHVQLLVTGSLYLVGGVLQALGWSVNDV